MNTTTIDNGVQTFDPTSCPKCGTTLSETCLIRQETGKFVRRLICTELSSRCGWEGITLQSGL